MKKTLLLTLIISIVLVLPGCVKPNKEGKYTEFVRREDNLAGQKDAVEDDVRIYGVYPSSVSTKDLKKIRIYGAGFEKGSRLFLNRPEITVETNYLNPGLLEAWMPPYHQGMFKLGVINQDGKLGYWSRLFRYINKDEESN